MGTKEPSLRRNLRETSRSGIPWSYWFRKILLPSSCYGFSPHSTNTECFTDTSLKVDVNIKRYFYFSVTRYGLGLVPALCSLVGVVETYFMELNSTILKPRCQSLLLECTEGRYTTLLVW
ncbi:hypothetical protein ISN44_As08g004330 [Arabidopsis suecica]|nr:hypothetical protein ISN44_As08g004330 [Arabidopsis suecica]